jgi:site-specific DNA-cytosine methylase
MSGDLVMANREHGVPKAADETPTQTACTGHGCGLAVVHPRGTVEVQRNGDVRWADETPVHTVRAGGQHHAVVVAHYTPGVTKRAGEAPLGPVTTRDHHSLVVPYYGTGVARDGDRQPVGAVTGKDRVALVVPAASGNVPALADREPASTVTQVAKHGIVWTDADIDACTFRMFELHEIAGAMAMAHGPRGHYEVLGNKRERMAQYGNSVTPPAMAWLIGRLAAAGIDCSRIIDLFCGAGGSSTGAEFAGGTLVLGLNHWKRAIETHAANFPHADHDCEDISSLTTGQLRRYLHHGRPTVMIAGPECTNHSIAKGARRRKPQAASLWDDGPAGDDEQDKSRATMWDVARFAEQALLLGQPLEAIVVENVVDAFRWGANDDGGLFNAWLTAIDALGYEHEIVWLNSMFAPPAGGHAAPQSRDRMYVVFWRRGLRRPDLLVQPPAWCPHCEQLVHGIQTWKRPDRRPWGRYGAQYFYACPDCRKPAIPGAFPAASIIDDALPAQRIGDRARPLAPKTRERIRRTTAPRSR